jgi:hypothetical protein
LSFNLHLHQVQGPQSRTLIILAPTQSLKLKYFRSTQQFHFTINIYSGATATQELKLQKKQNVFFKSENIGKYTSEVNCISLFIYVRVFVYIYRLDARKNFFSERVVNTWNALPSNVVSAESVNVFKSLLDRHWTDMGTQN